MFRRGRGRGWMFCGVRFCARRECGRARRRFRRGSVICGRWGSALEFARDARRDWAHPELAAENLRHARDALAGITGGFGDEELLGEIFSRFCVGK